MSAPQTQVSVLIVDDDREFRGMVRRILVRESWIEVVGEAESYREAESLLGRRSCDVVLMDLSMPGMHGLAATRLLKQVHPDTRVVIVTVHDELPYRRAALDSGADAFVLKKAIADELLPAIRSVRREDGAGG
jgi:DNA-binding NarL/FixJ family response regulator